MYDGTADIFVKILIEYVKVQKCVPGWIIDPTVGIEIWREQWPRVYEEGLFIIGFSDTYEFLVQGIVAYVPLSSLEIIPVKIAIKSSFQITILCQYRLNP